MRIDPDLVRQILLRIEDTPPNKPVGVIDLPGRDSEAVLEHLEQLHDRGYIEAKISHDHSRGDRRLNRVFVMRMTPTGHDFLDNARSSTVWSHATKFVSDNGGSVSLDVLATVVSQFATKLLGLG